MLITDEGRGNTSHSHCGQGRGGRATQSQRKTEAKAEAEADFAEISSGGMSCFNAEISQDISDMSMGNNKSAGAQDEIVPTVLFVTAQDLAQSEDDTVSQSNPKMEYS